MPCRTGLSNWHELVFGPETMRNLVCLWRLSWIGMVSALTLAWAADVGPRRWYAIAVSDSILYRRGEHLPGNGIGTDTLRQMLRAGRLSAGAGHSCHGHGRCADSSGMDSKLDGYFPEYTTADTRRRCQLSAPIGTQVCWAWRTRRRSR